jgi:hypothetical protein
MKKLLVIGVLIALSPIVSYPQLAGKLFQATLKPGTTPNSVKAVIKPSATFTGQFSNLQFTFQIPNTITPQPVLTIKSNSLAAYIPTTSYVMQVTNEGGFYNYLFATVPTGQPAYSFVANNEIDALEVQAIGTEGVNVNMRLASLANGGSTGQLNFYIEVSGNDNTNFTSMFYGTGAVNSGSYLSYSYVPLSNVILPLKLVQFNTIKNGDNTTLNWLIENETVQNSHFDIERSSNGTLFTPIGKLSVLNNGKAINAYKYTDQNISTIKNNGIIYYRLKQVDRDGQFVYSETKKILVNTAAFNFGILNNPVKGGIANLTIQSEIAGKGTLRLFNAEGKIVHKSVLSWTGGFTEHTVVLGGLSSGSYIANLVCRDKQYQLKFVK